MARTCVLGPVVPARSVYRGDEQTRAQLFSGAFFFFFFPLVLQRFFVLRGAVSCWNSFHNKLKNPAVALEAAVEAEGSCVLSRMGGAVQLLRWVPCQTQCQPGWGWGVASARGWLGLGHRRKPRAGWIVRYRGPEAERGRTTELTFPRCH